MHIMLINNNINHCVFGLPSCNRRSKRLLPLKSWVRFSFRTQNIHVYKFRQRYAPKAVAFLRVLRFPPCIQGGLGLGPNWPSTVAACAPMIMWLPEGPLEGLRLHQVELRPSQFSLPITIIHTITYTIIHLHIYQFQGWPVGLWRCS
jgi:hypothetical protein